MRLLRYASVLAMIAGPALAQPAVPVTPQGVPPGANPETGARPGNDIGTASSLPRGNRDANIDTNDTRSRIAPNLPNPAVGEEGSPEAYLRAAQEALQGGRTGEAQQSLEMAQTRLLNSQRQDSPAMDQIRSALKALADGDRTMCMQSIDAALQTASR